MGFKVGDVLRRTTPISHDPGGEKQLWKVINILPANNMYKLQWIPSRSGEIIDNCDYFKDDVELNLCLHETQASQRLSQPCEHKWRHYIGVIEVYDFCEKCDTKKYKK